QRRGGGWRVERRGLDEARWGLRSASRERRVGRGGLRGGRRDRCTARGFVRGVEQQPEQRGQREASSEQRPRALHACSRRARRSTLPRSFLGRSSRKSTRRGYLCGASSSFTQLWSAVARGSPG